MNTHLEEHPRRLVRLHKPTARRLQRKALHRPHERPLQVLPPLLRTRNIQRIQIRRPLQPLPHHRHRPSMPIRRPRTRQQRRRPLRHVLIHTIPHPTLLHKPRFLHRRQTNPLPRRDPPSRPIQQHLLSQLPGRPRRRILPHQRPRRRTHTHTHRDRILQTHQLTHNPLTRICRQRRRRRILLRLPRHHHRQRHPRRRRHRILERIRQRRIPKRLKGGLRGGWGSGSGRIGRGRGSGRILLRSDRPLPRRQWPHSSHRHRHRHRQTEEYLSPRVLTLTVTTDTGLLRSAAIDGWDYPPKMGRNDPHWRCRRRSYECAWCRCRCRCRCQ